MRVHLLGVAYNPVCMRRYPFCSYSAVLLGVSRMLRAYGTPGVAYVVQGSHVPAAAEVVEVVAAATVRRAYPDVDDGHVIDRNGWSEAYDEFTARAAAAVEARARKGDVVIAFHGRNHQPVCERLRARLDVVVLELPGHTGHWAPFCAFPSRAFMHHEVGAGRRALAHHDACVPHAVPTPLDPGDAPPASRRRYALFVGRDVPAKGLQMAIEACAHAGVPLHVAGQHPASGARPACVGVVHHGVVSAEQRDVLMRGAMALLMPTLVCEPFGLVAAEALAQGCPVITLEWGGAAELVAPGTGFVCRTIGDVVTALRAAPRLLPAACVAHAREVVSDLAVASQLMPWMAYACAVHRGEPVAQAAVRPPFGRAICINLDRRMDRMARMRRVLARYGLQAQRQSAADGADAATAAREPRCAWTDDDVQGHAAQKHACFLSHLDAWRSVAAGDDARVLVCEDDVFFREDWLAVLAADMAALPGNRLYMLNGMHRDEPRDADAVLPAMGCVLTGCYLLHRDAARRLVERFERAPEVADMALAWYQRTCAPGEAHVRYPYLAMQLCIPSDVQRDAHTSDVERWLRAYMQRHADRYALT
jgi:GR25 family glycosyltransferase involved in LPS biosynthesis/glycosyltransferase involved in cell wall biosynthesis